MTRDYITLGEFIKVLECKDNVFGSILPVHVYVGDRCDIVDDRTRIQAAFAGGVPRCIEITLAEPKE